MSTHYLYYGNSNHLPKLVILLILAILIALLMVSCKGLEPKTVRYYEKRGFKVYKPVSDKHARNKTLKSKKHNCSWTW